MAKYGYVRKGFPMNETEQLAGLIKYECDELFFEGASLVEEVELMVLLARLNDLDQVVVMSLQVFGKSLRQLQSMIGLFKEKKIRLISVEDGLDTKTDRFFYPFFDLLVETDSDCKSERMKQKIRMARQIGKPIGRPTLDENTIDRISFLYHDQKWSMRRIATECEVSLGSVYKYTQQEEAIPSEASLR